MNARRPRSTAAVLADMLDAVEGIRGAVAGIDFDVYRRDWVRRRAVERGLEIISEASRRLPSELRDSRPDIPWRQIAAIGNVLRHEYQRIEDRLVWNVVGSHLPALEAAVRAMTPRADKGEPESG